MKTAIAVENLSKAYRIGLKKEQIPDTLAGAVGSWMRAPLRNLRNLTRLDTLGGDESESNLHWALKDISFEVADGDVTGIIGCNGAGKSTLLKILSRITQPTSGRAVIHGRVSSLLEVGTGFHPELSGRENIFMNGTILGMRKSEIARKFDEIVDFSGVEKFLDVPIKRYSSGMKVRLAFAVAAHLEPEILLVDEVLAVGDHQFQTRCLGKMQDVADSGRTVLFVSHNMAAVETLCSHGILIRQGRIGMSGPVDEVVKTYLNMGQPADSGGLATYEGDDALIRKVRLIDEAGDNVERVGLGSCIRFEILLYSGEPLIGLTVRVVLTSQSGVRVFNCNSRIETNRLFSFHGWGRINCRIPDQRLSPGRYFVSVAVFNHGHELENAEPAIAFDVSATDIFGTGLLPSSHKAVYLPQCDWSFEDQRTSF